MAVTVQSASADNGRRTRRRKRATMVQINMTPLVDVMLVLLIVFMVAAPMMTAGVPIDLPKTTANALENPTVPVTVAITPEGQIFVGEDPVAEADLITTVMARATNGTEDRILLRIASSLDYGAAMRVMSLLSANGFTKIGLQTEKAPGTP